jgi:hypothetical protein
MIPTLTSKPSRRGSISLIGKKVYPNDNTSSDAPPTTKEEETKSSPEIKPITSSVEVANIKDDDLKNSSTFSSNERNQSSETVDSELTVVDEPPQESHLVSSPEHGQRNNDPITYKPLLPMPGHSLLSEDGDNSDDDDENDHVIVKKLPCVIMPSSPGRIAWDLFILFLLAYILVSTPLELAWEEIDHKLETMVT